MEGTRLRQAEQVQHLAEAYASYSVSKGGLGKVLGGLTSIAVYLIDGLFGQSLWTTLLTIGLTLAWLGGKEVLRVRLYRPFGIVQEIPTQETKRLLPWILGLCTFTALGLWVLAWIAFLSPSLHIGIIRLMLGLICATSMPWLSWRFLRTMNEFMVGFFLFICCAITSLGGAMAPSGVEGWLGLFWVPLYGLILIGSGITEHRTFRQLERQLQAEKEQV